MGVAALKVRHRPVIKRGVPTGSPPPQDDAPPPHEAPRDRVTADRRLATAREVLLSCQISQD
jgi:hypothetical protein